MIMRPLITFSSFRPVSLSSVILFSSPFNSWIFMLYRSYRFIPTVSFLSCLALHLLIFLGLTCYLYLIKKVTRLGVLGPPVMVLQNINIIISYFVSFLYCTTTFCKLLYYQLFNSLDLFLFWMFEFFESFDFCPIWGFLVLVCVVLV